MENWILKLNWAKVKKNVILIEIELRVKNWNFKQESWVNIFFSAKIILSCKDVDELMRYVM